MYFFKMVFKKINILVYNGLKERNCLGLMCLLYLDINFWLESCKYFDYICVLVNRIEFFSGI